MKYFVKDNIVKKQNQIIINKDGFNIINPSVEDILAAGWVEYRLKGTDYRKLIQLKNITEIKERLFEEFATSNINKYNFSGNDAASLTELYPEWKPDIDVVAGEYYKFEEKLYKVITSHRTQENWKPSINTASIWELTNFINRGDETDPIVFEPGLALVKGKYYVEDLILYYCNEDSVNPIYNRLDELITSGRYIELV